VIPLLAIPLAAALAAARPLEPPTASPGCREAGDPAAPPGRYCAELAVRSRLPLASPADRQALREVYARPELRRARADTAGLRRLLARLWERVLELLGSAEAERYAGVGRTVFLTAALTAAVTALAAVRRRAAARSAPRAPERLAISPVPPADRSAAQAEQAFARGDLAAAVRHAFLSALAALEEAGRIPRGRALTNRELASGLAPGSAALAGGFETLSRTFDRTVYGGARVEAPEARASLAQALKIRTMAGGGA